MRELSKERTPVISVHRDRTIDTNYTETLMGKKVNKNSVTCGKNIKKSNIHIIGVLEESCNVEIYLKK